MNAMLLAAGLGTRLAPLTNSIAKPAIPFLDVPMLCYSLYALEALPLSRVVINTHHLPHTIEAAVEKSVKGVGYKVEFSPEQPVILDSAGGMNKAKESLVGGGNFVIANADSILLLKNQDTVLQMQRDHAQSNALATILVLPHERATGKHNSVWTHTSGRVVHIGKDLPEPYKTERAQGSPHYQGYFYASVIIMNDRIFDYIPKQGPSHIFKDVFLPAIAKGELIKAHIEPKALWFETGDLQNLEEASKTVRSLLAHKFGDFSSPLLNTPRVPPEEVEAYKKYFKELSWRFKV